MSRFTQLAAGTAAMAMASYGLFSKNPNITQLSKELNLNNIKDKIGLGDKKQIKYEWDNDAFKSMHFPIKVSIDNKDENEPQAPTPGM